MRQNGIKLGIGVPYYNGMHVKTAFSLIGTLLQFEGYPLALIKQGCYVHWNREEIAQRAIGEHCSHLWFVDTDMIFPPTGLQQLIDADKEIIAGYYKLRALAQPHSTIKTIEDDGFADVWPENMPKEPFKQVNGKPITAPTGFMLIKVSALQKIEPPRFQMDYLLGEDIYFCRKAVQAGIEVWCDPNIEIGHIGEAVY